MPAYDPRVPALCLPGERPLASAGVRYLEGAERLGEPAGSWAEEGVSVLAGVGGPRLDRLGRRLVGGTSLRGWPGCWAQGLRDVVDADVVGVEMVVTDRRLLVLPVGDGDRVLWSAGRPHVAGVRRAPRALQRGRLRIDLADGSWVMVISGLVASGGARRLAAAW